MSQIDYDDVEEKEDDVEEQEYEAEGLFEEESVSETMEESLSDSEQPEDLLVEQVYATGRRKSAIARVWLRRGKGRFSVNDMSLDDYFNRETQRMIVKQPMRLTKSLNDFDVIATVKGGGKSSQSDAVKHGISKALVLYNEEEYRS